MSVACGGTIPEDDGPIRHLIVRTTVSKSSERLSASRAKAAEGRDAAHGHPGIPSAGCHVGPAQIPQVVDPSWETLRRFPRPTGRGREGPPGSAMLS